MVGPERPRRQSRVPNLRPQRRFHATLSRQRQRYVYDAWVGQERPRRQSRSRPSSRPRRQAEDESRELGQNHDREGERLRSRNRDRRENRIGWSEDYERGRGGVPRSRKNYNSRSRRQSYEDDRSVSQQIFRNGGHAWSRGRTFRRPEGPLATSRGQETLCQPAGSSPTTNKRKEYPPRPDSSRRPSDSPRERTVGPRSISEPNPAPRGDGSPPGTQMDKVRGGPAEDSWPHLHRHGVHQRPQEQPESRGREGENTERQEEGWMTVHRRRRDTPPQDRRPVDPRREGRCFHCLPHDHLAYSCRTPIRCRLCRREGHRQASCSLTLKTHSTTAGHRPEATGLFSCLVGEVRGGGAPNLEQIKGGVQDILSTQANPDRHFLPSGDLFLGRLSRKALRAMGGRRQQLTGGGFILWRRPHKTDGAFPTRTKRHRLELRGVPFRACTRRLIQHTLWPLGRLLKIVQKAIRTPSALTLRCEWVSPSQPHSRCMGGGGGGRARKHWLQFYRYLLDNAHEATQTGPLPTRITCPRRHRLRSCRQNMPLLKST